MNLSFTVKKFQNTGDTHEFLLSTPGCGPKFIAYGTFTDEHEYCVSHGPTQVDVDVISELLDRGIMPAERTGE